jgi:hypothetical protein
MSGVVENREMQEKEFKTYPAQLFLPCVEILWNQFLAIISFAGSKEIQISAEAMDAVDGISRFLQQFWKRPPMEIDSSSTEQSGESDTTCSSLFLIFSSPIRLPCPPI